MNINELYHLARWYQARYPQISKLYKALLGPLRHNATQPNKQPVEEQLQTLTDYLESLSFDELSMQQLELLESLGVDIYLGPNGSEFLNSTIRTAEFDPATAVAKVEGANSALSTAHANLTAYRDAVDKLEVDFFEFEEPDDFITIRVGFRNDAEIKNVTDWKDSARDWYDIIRGVALAVREPPENTKVVGAGTGSIILILAATATVTTLLAIIAKNATGVAKNVLEVLSTVEDLRQKKLLNQVIEKELNEKVGTLKEDALETIMKELKQHLPKSDGEVATALAKSIQKILAFNEKGGNLDFVAPAGDLEDEEKDGNASDLQALAKARDAIQQYHVIRDEVKLITDASNDD